MADDEAAPRPRSDPRAFALTLAGYMVGWAACEAVDRGLTRLEERSRRRAARRAAAADHDPEHPEPRRPGVYRCSSPPCGYHWCLDGGTSAAERWIGPFLASGALVTGSRVQHHTWRTVDENWGDCAGRLEWVHADMQGYFRDVKKGTAR